MKFKKSNKTLGQTTKNEIRTASYYRRTKRQHVLSVLLKIILLFSMVFIVWITDIGCAWGWIKNAKAGDNWPSNFVGYGQMLLAASILITLGILLVFLRRNWIAIASATIGIVLCLIAVFQVAAYAADSGFYSKVMDMSVDTLYRLEILPTILPYICLVLLALLQFFSVEAKEKRLEKRRKEEEEAPSII